MSTSSWKESFEEPHNSARSYRLVRQILSDLFHPSSAFSPPIESDYSLKYSEGISINEVLSEVHEKISKHAVNSRHKWAAAHMVPPPATISVIADLLIGAMNQCAFVWEEAPLAAILETEVIRWMANRIGFGSRATGLLTSGGTMSNCLTTYLALKRVKKLLVQDVSQYCIVASDQAHFSIEKAAALTGLGADAVIRVATDSQGRLHPGQVRNIAKQIKDSGRIPFLFICTAGTTNTGALEPIDEILLVAREFQAWCHVDAAHGGLVCLSDKKDKSLDLWPEADSVSWDPHKSLYVSYAVGALILQDQTMLAPLKFNGEYALKEGECFDAGNYHLEGSRRFEALKLWMSIKHFGIGGFSSIINHTLSLAKEIAERIRSLDDFVLITEPDTNIVCFRFVAPYLSKITLNKVNDAIQKELFLNGGPLLSSTKIGGYTILRMVILNPCLDIGIFDEILEHVRFEAHRQVSLASSAKKISGVLL